MVATTGDFLISSASVMNRNCCKAEYKLLASSPRSLPESLRRPPRCRSAYFRRLCHRANFKDNLHLYITFTRRMHEYALIVWDGCSKQIAEKREKVQLL